jgi:ribosomal protein L35
MTATGKMMAAHAGKRHGMIKRAKEQIRQLRGTRVLFKTATTSRNTSCRTPDGDPRSRVPLSLAEPRPRGDPSATVETKDSDLVSENASLRKRLMRALAETDNIKRQGERREQDAQQYAITNFTRETICGVPSKPARPTRDRERQTD